MEICGEHGADIAYSKDRYNTDCPACDQIETIEKEHTAVVDDKNDEIEELNTEIETLRDDLYSLQEEAEMGRS